MIDPYLKTVEEYKPLTDPWATREDMPTGRIDLTLTQINGKLLAAGGGNTSPAIALESYDPATASVVNARMYVFGNALTLEYDPANEIR